MTLPTLIIAARIAVLVLIVIGIDVLVFAYLCARMGALREANEDLSEQQPPRLREFKGWGAGRVHVQPNTTETE